MRKLSSEEYTRLYERQERQDYDAVDESTWRAFLEELKYDTEIDIKSFCFRYSVRSKEFRGYCLAHDHSISLARIKAREAQREARKLNKGSWGSTFEGFDAVPGNMFIQFVPGAKPFDGKAFHGVSIKFSDGTSLTVQDCTPECLQSFIDIQKERAKECSR